MEVFKAFLPGVTDMSIAERALDYIRAYRAIIPIDVDDIDGRDFQDEIDETMCHLRSLPLVRVVQRAQAGDAEMKIELGLRKYSGFGIEKDSEAAFESWKAIAEDRQHWTHPLRDAPAVRAILCLCMYRMSTYEEKKDGWDLVQCVLWAEQAAEYGLVTPPGLFAVRQLHQTLASFAIPAAACFSEKDKAFYRRETAGIKFMWTFMRRRTDALERGEQALEEKARSAPNKHACAREGCGIRAESQTALRRCGGPCAPERKPHYCSRECQKTDWKRHQGECKRRAASDGDGDVPASLTSPPPSANPLEISGAISVPGPPSAPKKKKKKGKGRSKTVRMVWPTLDGKGIEVSTSTVSPEEMWEMRQTARETIRRRKEGGGEPSDIESESSGLSSTVD